MGWWRSLAVFVITCADKGLTGAAVQSVSDNRGVLTFGRLPEQVRLRYIATLIRGADPGVGRQVGDHSVRRLRLLLHG